MSAIQENSQASQQESEIVRNELRWTLAVIATSVLISGAILWASLVHLINPPAISR